MITSGDDAAAGKAAPEPRRGSPLARAGHLEYDRILFFSDAVFAIAITLLIVDLPVQVERSAAAQQPAISSARELHDAIPGIEGFAISFAVIGLFWVGHHGLFRYITAFDRPLLLLNLLLLGFIAFLPFPTALLSSVSSNQRTAVVFYAACAGSAGLIETVCWVYAYHSRAGLTTGVDRNTYRLQLLRAARVPAVFAASIVVAMFSPRVATYCWVALIVTGAVINHLYGRQRPGPDAAARGDSAAGI